MMRNFIAYLEQGKRRFNVPKLEMQKDNSKYIPSNWEIKIIVSDVLGLYKLWKQNRVFTLHVECVRQKDGTDILQTFHGEIEVSHVQFQSLPPSFFAGYNVYASASTLKFSEGTYFDDSKEKVQFN